MSHHIEEPHNFDDIFQIIPCLKDNVLCKLTSKNKIYQSRKTYIYYLTEELNTLVCKDGWIINDNHDDRLGEVSASATIYTSRCNEKLYVAKFIVTDERSPIAPIINEILIQNKVYSRFPNITIPIYQAFLAEDYSFVILMMDLIRGSTVYRYIEENIDNDELSLDIVRIVAHCKKLVKFLFYTGYIIHGDTHLHNFMFIPGKTPTIKMIDFGRSKEIIQVKQSDFRLSKTAAFKKQYEGTIETGLGLYQSDLTAINSHLKSVQNDKISADKLKSRIELIIKLSNSMLDSYKPNEPPVLDL